MLASERPGQCPPTVKVSPAKAIGAVTNGGASCEVEPLKVTLQGTINPNGSPTTYKFEWGAVNGVYTESTPPSEKPVEGTTTVAVSVSATVNRIPVGAGQNCATIYFRLVATNAAGTTTPSSSAKLEFDTEAGN